MMKTKAYRVLVIDDSPTMRAVCAQSLTEHGLKVKTTGTAEEALSMLEQNLGTEYEYDGILLDWVLPKMSGAELMEELVKDKRYQRLSIMIFTERADDIAYQLASTRVNNDIQLKEELSLLPFRMSKFLATFESEQSIGNVSSRISTQDNIAPTGKILFVDDSPTVRLKYHELLHANGYKVELASCMQEALTKVETWLPDLAIVDYYMPGGNGDELCQALLANQATKNITVVMHSQKKDATEVSLRAGALDLIWKDDPVNIFLMRVDAIMRNILAQKKAKQLDVLYSVTQQLGVGVLIKTNNGYEALNETMKLILERTDGQFFFDSSIQNGKIVKSEFEDTEYSYQVFNTKLSSGENIIMVQDISVLNNKNEELIVARDKAMESARMKTQFLANMSHELRTPLNGVIGMMNLLKATELELQQQHYCQVAIKSAESLVGVIGDILDFSKIDAGKIELDIVSFDMLELMSDCMEAMAHDAEKKTLELILEYQPEVPTQFVSDPTRLRQIITNMANNAIKFTESGQVLVKVEFLEKEEEQHHIRFVIEDSGIGMTEEAIDKVFTPFVQADNTTTRRFGGTGLGLSISLELIKLLGGNIKVTSEVDIGTRFCFDVWLKEDIKAESPLMIAKSHSQKLFKGLTIYLSICNQQLLSTIQYYCDSYAINTQVISSKDYVNLNIDENSLLILDHNPNISLANEVIKDNIQHWQNLPVLGLISLANSFQVASWNFGKKIHWTTKPLNPLLLLNAIATSLDIELPGQLQKHIHGDISDLKLDGHKILVAEDHLVNQEVIRGILENAGCIVEVVDNGMKALEAYKKGQFEIILMDCEMPIMNGIESTETIRKFEKSVNKEPTPIIALTAHSLVSERSRTQSAGMNGFLTKPIKPEILLKELANFLQIQQPVQIAAKALPIDSNLETSVDFSMIEDLKMAIPKIEPLLTSYLADIRDHGDKFIRAEYQSQEDLLRNTHMLGGATSTFGSMKLSAQLTILEKKLRQLECKLPKQEVDEILPILGQYLLNVADVVEDKYF
jgi:signal transduction histidine kinase/DNA-binding LytR/AlgR family response regulator